MSPLPPPGPALWAPGLHAFCSRCCGWMDRRKARNISAAWRNYQDQQWREQYQDWWMNHGWQQGADNPDLAWAKVQSTRR